MRRSITLYLTSLSVVLIVGTAGCASYKNKGVDTVYSKVQWAERCADWDEWDKPAPPFRIFGNSYYVGTCGITAILITGESGHVLIDGGTEAGADVIAANIRSLGFSLRQVKILLHSHEHFDHVAGLAKLQQLSGAKLLASVDAAPVLRAGITSAEDPQADMHDPFPPAIVDGYVHEADPVVIGELALMPIPTPGHTHGALSWQWKSCEKDRCLTLVYADSLSPISNDHYRFGDHPAYVDSYRAGLQKLSALSCDILITPHPSASQMRSRMLAGGLEDRSGCKIYVDSVLRRLNQRLADEL